MQQVVKNTAQYYLSVENCRVFVIDLLNFSFWSEEADDKPRYCVSYAGHEWTGYWSLCAAFNRALDVGPVSVCHSFSIFFH